MCIRDSFTAYRETLSKKEFERKSKAAIKAELVKIRSALNHLGAGKKARNSFEERIIELFTTKFGSSRRAYIKAAGKKRVRYQTGIKEKFEEGLKRSGKYLGAIETVFSSYGLPVELGRLPLVESSFDYKAYSSVGAAGVWQFMRSTGKLYMRVDSTCLLYTSPSPRDATLSRMPSSA